jgi:hypothetical protein
MGMGIDYAATLAAKGLTFLRFFWEAAQRSLWD